MPPARSHEEILTEFRGEVLREKIIVDGDSLGMGDETLLRFLRARKFDLKQAKTMLVNCQHWRKTVEDVGIDELYRQIDPFDYPEREAVFDCWPLWFHKTDKKGRPLNIHHLGAMDIQKLYKSCTPERHWQTILVNAELLTREILPASSRKAGKHIGSVFVIVDLKGFHISQFWQMKGLVQKSFQTSQDYYPETMGQLAIINAPPSFTFIWSMVKRWLSKETVDKIDILGSDYQDVLLSLIDAENLPSTLGGTCTCTEDGGCHKSGRGPWLDGRIGWGPKASKTTNGTTNTTEEEKRLSLDSTIKVIKEVANGGTTQSITEQTESEEDVPFRTVECQEHEAQDATQHVPRCNW